MEKKDVIISTKDNKFEKLKINLKKFWNNHPFVSSTIVLGTGGLIGFFIKSLLNSKELKDLSIELDVLESSKEALIEEKARLLARCDEKDNYFKKFISQALRDGYSQAGSEMNYRKEYLKSLD